MALRLPDLSGASHSLDAWKGQPMLVNFWATWCAPCVKEMPELDALQKNIRKCALWVSALIQPPTCRNLSRKCRFRIRWVLGAGGIDVLCKLGNPSGGLPLRLFSMQMVELTGRSWVKFSLRTWIRLWPV